MKSSVLIIFLSSFPFPYSRVLNRVVISHIFLKDNNVETDTEAYLGGSQYFNIIFNLDMKDILHKINFFF